MSGNAAPISAARFAAALPDLPLSSLYAKGAEIRNSVAHLELSNDELQSYDSGEDPDCKEALRENLDVIARMSERLELLKKEVEHRGFKWDEQTWLANGGDDDEDDEDEGGDVAEIQAGGTESESAGQDSQGDSGSTPRPPPAARHQGGSLGDEELARMLAGRMNDDDDEMEEDDDGVHL